MVRHKIDKKFVRLTKFVEHGDFTFGWYDLLWMTTSDDLVLEYKNAFGFI